MRIGIGTDHNGTEIKKELIRFLSSRGYEVKDYSSNSGVGDDYPEYAFLVGEAVASRECDLGILLCGTGIGMSIAANKVKGVRCAHITSTSEAMLARAHNNANVISMGTNSNTVNEMIKYIDIFLSSECKEERHIRRNNQIMEYENK